jgi:hypothetical protein
MWLQHLPSHLTLDVLCSPHAAAAQSAMMLLHAQCPSQDTVCDVGKSQCRGSNCDAWASSHSMRGMACAPPDVRSEPRGCTHARHRARLQQALMPCRTCVAGVSRVRLPAAGDARPAPVLPRRRRPVQHRAIQSPCSTRADAGQSYLGFRRGCGTLKPQCAVEASETHDHTSLVGTFMCRLQCFATVIQAENLGAGVGTLRQH